ncbi:GTP cyclohydrolase 1 feedback regulatory protein isoform X2 [Rhinolophus ferrumequinum]|uniref:GTP cyclohydrolase 1 feedback regulatory protein isoform X2 n=1 Tax=Rhinolophus ferrumequinum TaxID=59479 RepID=UPI00140FF979|nr:GTP cyclohydrolase 1 feedback regulatory protein isoform X2 [Rhinolophus ferrumequinum]
MPYLLISTQIRMEAGPTMVGDEYSDPELMRHLGASKRSVLGNNLAQGQSQVPGQSPRTESRFLETGLPLNTSSMTPLA